MKYLIYIVLGIFALIFLLYVIYFFLLSKLKKINKKIYKYKFQEVTREKNILIIYQPSRHKTTSKICELLKEIIDNKGYGYRIETLSKEKTDYNKYLNVIFISPVYFGHIHDEFLSELKNKKIANLTIIYNGLNAESDNEDKEVKNISKSNYNKIKLHTNDIDQVKNFIERIIK